LPHGVTDRVLPSGIGADLAAEHADRIGPLLQGTVIPVLDGGEAEADGLASGGMLPCAPGQPLDRGLQLAFGGRRRQQLSDDGEAQLCRAYDYAECSAVRFETCPVINSLVF